MKQLRVTGSWGAPSWSNPMIAAAVQDVGGWMYLCMTENVTADRARFIAAYDVRMKRRTQDMMQLPASARYQERLAAQVADSPMARISDLAKRMALPSRTAH
jgi:hypothetical protein